MQTASVWGGFGTLGKSGGCSDGMGCSEARPSIISGSRHLWEEGQKVGVKMCWFFFSDCF